MRFLTQSTVVVMSSLLMIACSGLDNGILYDSSSSDISKPTKVASISVRVLPRLDCYLDEVSNNRKTAFAELRTPCMENATLLALEEHNLKSITNSPA